MDENNLMSDKREFNRVNCEINVVLAGQDGSIEAESVDISENGFRLISDKMFPLNSRYELTFSLNDEIKDIKCVAILVWTNKMAQNDRFVSGFVFSNVSQEDRLKLRKFIQEAK
jgi:c-di-GMP-binding flagellar brake protein YcgR